MFEFEWQRGGEQMWKETSNIARMLVLRSKIARMFVLFRKET
jgi:hypothetical protein